MTIADIRRENARLLAKLAGTRTKFGERVGMDASQVSQIIGRSPKKSIGNSIARRIENAFRKPIGWMDVINSEVNVEAATGEQLPDNIELQVHWVNELGDITKEPSIETASGVRKITISLSSLKGKVKFSSVKNLALTPATSNHMEPTFKINDLLLIDLGANRIDGDGIYGTSIDDGSNIFIRRIETRMDGDIFIVSDNKNLYREPNVLKSDQQHRVQIRYRVLSVFKYETFF